MHLAGAGLRFSNVMADEDDMAFAGFTPGGPPEIGHVTSSSPGRTGRTLSRPNG